MAKSIFEQTIGHLIKDLSAKLRTHDRGVVIGFIFSLLPIFPVVFLGFGLGIFHVLMHRAGRISHHDYGLARRGLFLAAFNCILTLLLIWGVVHMASGIQWERIGDSFINYLRSIFNIFFGHVTPELNRNGVVV